MDGNRSGTRLLGDEHVYTVAVQTDTAGLDVSTRCRLACSGGELELAGYPAFVGAPASGAAPAPAHLREVQEPVLATVVERALRNYLDGIRGRAGGRSEERRTRLASRPNHSA